MTIMNNYYTYAYLRENGTPYYVGKGKGKRAYEKNNHKSHGIHIPPNDRIIILKNNLTESEAFCHEIHMIKIFGRKDLNTGILYNKTNGGDKPPLAKKGQMNRIVSQKNYWKSVSEEEKEKRRKKISSTKKGKGNYLPTRAVMIIELNKTFNSIKECAQFINGDPSAITKCLNNKGQNRHRGYTFKEIEK